MMKILINTSNIKKGGAVQVAHSFLSEIKQNKEFDFHVVLSNVLSERICKFEYPRNFTFYEYSKKLNVIDSFVGRDKFLDDLENRIDPSRVFSVFGPAYWSSRSKHIVGFADGWCYNPDSVAFRTVSLLSRFRLYLLIRFKNFRIRKEASILIVETQDAKIKICDYLNIPESIIVVVGNTVHSVFFRPIQSNLNLVERVPHEFRLLTVSAFYSHKNIEIIKHVIPFLIKKNLHVTFWLTISKVDFDRSFSSYKKWVKNVGPIDIELVPSLYQQCDSLFLPTLLETFTASYPEAMVMKKPIITSDLSFARDICGHAALYFNPLDAEDIANKIEEIVLDVELRRTLVEEGLRQFSKFELPKSRAEKYLRTFEI